MLRFRIIPAVILISLVATLALACGGPAAMPTAPPPTFPPPTMTPDPYAQHGAQDGPVASYWSGPADWEPEDVSRLERVSQRLVPPPFLPDHEQVYVGAPRVVEVRMEIEEREIEIAPGASSGPSPSTAVCRAPSSWSTRETTWN